MGYEWYDTQSFDEWLDRQKLYSSPREMSQEEMWSIDGKRKRCWKCGKMKYISRFHNNTTVKDGKHSICKVCSRKISRGRRRGLAKLEKSGEGSGPSVWRPQKSTDTL